MSDVKIVTKNFDVDRAWEIDVYESKGGYQIAKKHFGRTPPEKIVEEVKAGNLRGRGGAGFPAGLKWTFLPKDGAKPIYLVVNADEGEPGTFKDRYLLERDPHALIEGMLIAARAIRSAVGFVYIRGEYVQPWRRFSAAVREAYDAGLVSHVVADDGFPDELARVVKRLRHGAPLAQAATKRAINAAALAELEPALELERTTQTMLLRTADAAEGMRAFSEKRRPTFTGD